MVTGAAGFIGSHLCEELLRLGHDVTGLDAFIPYYPQAVKERNLSAVRGLPRFQFQQLDLRQDPLDSVVADAEVVFHLAAMPGLVKSWSDFDSYSSCNVQATQRLLEALRRAGRRLQRLLYISTSSVYGRFSSGDESLPAKPISPYGVTKLAAENLCRAYADAYQLPVVLLRYFSVYGPRQRPDMGYYRFIDALLRERPIVVYGDGQQVRGNTYVSDCVAATVAAMEARPGELYNIGGGETATVWEILRKLEALAGRRAVIRQEPARAGDQRYTFADTTKLRGHLGWESKTNLDDGLAQQWAWQKQELCPGDID
jgi:nucleoside-diphosphate-sugar epimerase